MDAVTRFETFEDLQVYCVAREFRKVMYGVMRQLAENEKFALADQVRRAAVSLTNNIAEGHGRFHYLDQIKFMLQARGSMQELIDDLNVCADKNYLSPDEVENLRQHAWRVSKLLGGYIRHLRKCKAGENLILRDSPPEYMPAEDFPDVTM